MTIDDIRSLAPAGTVTVVNHPASGQQHLYFELPARGRWYECFFFDDDDGWVVLGWEQYGDDSGDFACEEAYDEFGGGEDGRRAAYAKLAEIIKATVAASRRDWK